MNANCLRFAVKGHHHRGHVYLAVNGSDLFDVYLTTSRGTIKHTITDVFLEDLVDVIDVEVEHIHEYKYREVYRERNTSRPEGQARMKLISTEIRAISQAASQIAGAIFDEAEGTLEKRLKTAIAWKNLGTDSDLSSSDRDALKLLLDAATGITSDLCDSDTTEVIREATMEEAIESALARPEGHIWVDGRSCYVSF